MLNIANEIKGPHRFTGQITQRGAPSLNFEVRGSMFNVRSPAWLPSFPSVKAHCQPAWISSSRLPPIFVVPKSLGESAVTPSHLRAHLCTHLRTQNPLANRLLSRCHACRHASGNAENPETTALSRCHAVTLSTARLGGRKHFGPSASCASDGLKLQAQTSAGCCYPPLSATNRHYS
jgi:hypothetical protein